MAAMRTSIGSPILAALLLASASAVAQPESARQHFEAGKKLRDEGDCRRAIPEFEKSIAVETSIGALYNLGYCHEQLGHRPEAYAAYRSARQLASAKKDDRLREISGSLATLLETPHIRLALPEALPDGIEIKVDDQLVPSTFYQSETVVFTKPGTSHVVVVSAPGYEDRRERVDTKQLKAIELRPLSSIRDTPSDPRVDGWTTQHWVGIAVGVAGAGLFALGTHQGIEYLNRRSDIDERLARQVCTRDHNPGCPPGTPDDVRAEASALVAENNSLTDKEPIWALRSIGPLVLGTGALVAGIVLFATAEKRPSSPPTAGALRLIPNVSHREQGVSLVGVF